MCDADKTARHGSGDRSSPYPVSRLAPAFQPTDLAAELDRAESILSVRTSAKLLVIAEQIQTLQAEALKVLAEAREEHALNQAQCSFRRIPGHLYHLYCKENGVRFFSMLAPQDWGGTPPHRFVGSYRLEPDYSWSPANAPTPASDTGDLVKQLLEIGGGPYGAESSGD
jgi:hypothetical protein